MVARSGGARLRRWATAVALCVGVVVARALAPRLHARLTVACERMFERAPETFPPKRMLRELEGIRATSARTLALLEAREQRAVQVDRQEETELAAVGASARVQNAGK